MPPSQVKRDQNALTRKLGPLPAWAWAITAGVGLYLWRNRGGAGAANPNVPSSAPQDVNPETGLPWNIDPATGQPYGSDGGGGGSSPTGGDTGGGAPPDPPAGPAPDSPGTQPAPRKRKPAAKKPPRRRRIKIRRKPKATGPKHGRHKAPPPHRPAKPKRRQIIPGRKLHRDRKGVQGGAPHTHGVGARPRARVPKARPAPGPTLLSARSSTRADTRTHEQGGRGHEGGAHVSHVRARTPATAQGSNRRSRPTAAPKPPARPRVAPKPQAPAPRHAAARSRRK